MYMKLKVWRPSYDS